MRGRFVMLFGAVALLAACDNSAPVSPAAPDDAVEVIDLVPDYAVSPAASVDAAGVGAAQLPEELRLTVEQKAAIAALHDAFMTATATDIAALRAIEQEAHAAIRAESHVPRFAPSWRRLRRSSFASRWHSESCRRTSGRSTRRSSAPGSSHTDRARAEPTPFVSQKNR
jgi:hypothetical protein